LCALKKISRTEEGRLHGAARATAKAGARTERTLQQLMEEDEESAKGKKKYYN
jgi:hypothetical protein